MGSIDTGTVLGGKYRLEKLIGQGGMGSVWRAEHLGLHAPVAVKLLNVDLGGHAEALARFHREAQAAAAIRSPHVVQILDHGIDEGSGAPFIVMELMDGQSLADRLSRSGRIAPTDVARIFTHVARALSRAHEAGIVHRDLKPDNVFIVRNEDEEVAKVLDFGIAKTHGFGADSATRTGAVMGTAYYMSPEQISGFKEIDFRTDLWAFGVMACECLTGRRPFDADSIGGLTLKICVEQIPTPSSFSPVPPGFDAWFAEITNRSPAQRFASAREAAEQLRKLCTPDAATVLASVPVFQSPPKVIDNGARAHAMTTGAPLSHSGGDVEPRSARRARMFVPLSLGAVVVALTSGALWLRHVNASHSVESPDLHTTASGATGTPPVPSILLPAPGDTGATPSPVASAVAVALAPSASTAPDPSVAPTASVASSSHKGRHSGTPLPPIVPALHGGSSAPPAAAPPPVVRDLIDDRR